MLDLDKAREERVARRAAAAEHEGTGEGLPIVFGGQQIAVLPSELPFAALQPLQKINDEIALLLGQALRMQQGGRTIEGARLVLDLLSANGNLPTTLVEVAREIAAGLLGEEGLTSFLAARPSVADIGALVSGIFTFYGASLGESSRSGDSSESAGPNSGPTSPGSTDSTPEASSEPLALPGSSESGTSST